MIATTLAEVLASAREGEIVFPDARYLLPKPNHQGGMHTYFAPESHPLVAQGPRISMLQVRGGGTNDLLRETFDRESVDWHLKSGDEPYDSLDDLLSNLGLPTQRQLGDSACIELVAGAPGVVSDESSIKSGVAKLHVRLSKTADKRKAKIGLKFVAKDKIWRHSNSGEDFCWNDDVEWLHGTMDVPMDGANMVQAFLSYSGVAMHQWWLTDLEKLLNPRLVVDGVFDPNSEILRRMLLQPEEKLSRNFEWAVSSLFNLLGFSTNGYGSIPKLQQGPDIVAATPSGNLCVVECTIGLLNNNSKLAKLVQRAILVRERLNSKGHGHLQIQPVVVTPLSRAEVGGGMNDAKEHKIAVICKEDLESLLQRCGLPPNGDAVFQELAKLVPADDQSSFDGLGASLGIE